MKILGEINLNTAPPAYRRHKRERNGNGNKRMGRNLRNAVISILIPLPSIAFHSYSLHYHYYTSEHNKSQQSIIPSHPFLLANILFFLNVDVLFWIIGILQSSHWMIDLYWTVIPVMLVHFYRSHPLARFDDMRSKVVVLLTWVWSVRLTHSYFRRERWEWGAREDWRFAYMRAMYGKHWNWMSFFAVYVSQQILLIGVCLPMYVVHTSDIPWNIWDIVCAVTCITGILIAYFADTQLHSFMTRNEVLKELGAPTVLNLDKGLWHYSRHPNYFGEQLWWWGMFLFGRNVGHGWTFIGPLVNSLCLVYVTVLVEQRMLKKENRAEAYRQYQKTTSVWVPWFKFPSSTSKHKLN